MAITIEEQKKALEANGWEVLGENRWVKGNIVARTTSRGWCVEPNNAMIVTSLSEHIELATILGLIPTPTTEKE